jgi:hypothetical protein
MAQQCIVREQMIYNGVQRYSGEVMQLVGARNDEALVRVRYVVPVTGAHSPDADGRPAGAVHDSYSGRWFTDEGALNEYRRNAPQDAAIAVRTARTGRLVGPNGKFIKAAK